LINVFTIGLVVLIFNGSKQLNNRGNKMNGYEMAFWCGVIIALVWLLAYFLCWACQWAWAWIDDSKVNKANLIVSSLAKFDGWDDDGTNSMYYSKKGSGYEEGFTVFLKYSLGTSVLPVLSFICFDFYTVTLCALSLIAIARLARFSRRHKKLFDKHVKDPEAHKQ